MTTLQNAAHEVAAMLAGKGVDAEPAQVEELLAAMQARRAAVIGGGTGNDCSQADDCDRHFQDSFYQGVQRCAFANFCDEYTSELCHVSSGTVFGLAK